MAERKRSRMHWLRETFRYMEEDPEGVLRELRERVAEAEREAAEAAKMPKSDKSLADMARETLQEIAENPEKGVRLAGYVGRRFLDGLERKRGTK